MGVFIGTSSAQERQWSLDSSEDDAYLIFGVPESDDVGISFWCTMGSGEIRLFIPETDAALKSEQALDYTIEAGVTFALAGRTLANEEGASTSVETASRRSLPVRRPAKIRPLHGESRRQRNASIRSPTPISKACSACARNPSLPSPAGRTPLPALRPIARRAEHAPC